MGVVIYFDFMIMLLLVLSCLGFEEPKRELRTILVCSGITLSLCSVGVYLMSASPPDPVVREEGLLTVQAFFCMMPFSFAVIAFQACNAREALASGSAGAILGAGVAALADHLGLYADYPFAHGLVGAVCLFGFLALYPHVSPGAQAWHGSNDPTKE